SCRGRRRCRSPRSTEALLRERGAETRFRPVRGRLGPTKEAMTMVRKIVSCLAFLFVAANLALAGEANGTVKSVAGSGFVVTDSSGKDWSFDVDKNTTVLVKGGSHKMDAVKADGKPAQLSEFLSAKQEVNVSYTEKDGKMVAKDIRVKGGNV